MRALRPRNRANAGEYNDRRSRPKGSFTAHTRDDRGNVVPNGNWNNPKDITRECEGIRLKSGSENGGEMGDDHMGMRCHGDVNIHSRPSVFIERFYGSC